MADLKIGFDSFNTEWVSSYTSLPQFISDCPPHLCEGEDREAKLKEVYDTVHANDAVEEVKPKKK